MPFPPQVRRRLVRRAGPPLAAAGAIACAALVWATARAAPPPVAADLGPAAAAPDPATGGRPRGGRPDAPEPPPEEPEEEGYGGTFVGSFSDPAEFAEDAVSIGGGFPPGADLAPAIADAPGRAAVFADTPFADALGGQLVFLHRLAEREGGREVFLVDAGRKQRMPLGGVVQPSSVNRLEKWALNPDGTVEFLRAAPPGYLYRPTVGADF